MGLCLKDINMNHNIETRKIIHQHWNLSSGAKITGMIQKYWGIGKFKVSAKNEKSDNICSTLEEAKKIFG